MRKNVFYKKDYKEVNKNEFIETYVDEYYKKFKNSRYIEEEMERILYEGIKSEKDVVKILSWKMGKINHLESEKKKIFCYTKDWENAEEILGPNPQYTNFIRYIWENINDLAQGAYKNPQKTLNILKSNAPIGVGTVYLLCILFFITNGKMPMYDKFAFVAISAINNGKSPEEYIRYIALLGKDSSLFEKVYELLETEYIAVLKTVFGNKYISNRDIDRALWAYGHEFKIEYV